jgi:hypothetical protein
VFGLVAELAGINAAFWTAAGLLTASGPVLLVLLRETDPKRRTSHPTGRSSLNRSRTRDEPLRVRHPRDGDPMFVAGGKNRPRDRVLVRANPSGLGRPSPTLYLRRVSMYVSKRTAVAMLTAAALAGSAATAVTALAHQQGQDRSRGHDEHGNRLTLFTSLAPSVPSDPTLLGAMAGGVPWVLRSGEAKLSLNPPGLLGGVPSEPEH